MTVEREFYVGYQKQAPAALARFLRGAVAVLLLIASTLAVTLVVAQGRFNPGAFEFGVVRSFEGVIEEKPYPTLLVEPEAGAGSDGGAGDADEAPERLLLVAVGKHGADSEVVGLDGQAVRLEGTLIYREGVTMIEVARGSVEPAAEAAGAGPVLHMGSVTLGQQTLRGEVVDSKCFFGVMKPGRGKPHRACATRCISGGIPPVLRVETASGDFRHYLLLDENGASVNDRVLDLVAEPVEITGEVLRRDNLWYLEADPATYERI